MKTSTSVRIIYSLSGKPEPDHIRNSDRSNMLYVMLLIQPRSTTNLAGCQRPNLQTESKRPSSGILTTRNGGRPLFPESIRITTKKCTATAKEGCFYETVCNRCGRSAWS